MDLRLERFLKQHQQLDELSKRVLEINPKHALIKADGGARRAMTASRRRSATWPSCCSTRRASSKASRCPTPAPSRAA